MLEHGRSLLAIGDLQLEPEKARLLHVQRGNTHLDVHRQVGVFDVAGKERRREGRIADVGPVLPGTCRKKNEDKHDTDALR